MRLLKVDSTNGLSLTEDLPGNERLQYAILSHTWGKDEDEVTYEDLSKGTSETNVGYKKISLCAQQAICDGIQYIWVDTCCINKSNSNNNKDIELQTAINSMFRWYQNATKCYVYLEDVPDPQTTADGQPYPTSWERSLQGSRWFTRGWTLQELIAPKAVEFFSMNWCFLGSKTSLERQIYEITGIPVTALRGNPLSEFSVAERIAWAQKRTTRYIEDKAYSLQGIFDVCIPVLYGEGEEKAFRRLHEEIAKDKQGYDTAQFAISFSLADVVETEHFVAREKELVEMHSILSGDGSRRVAVLHGLGGIGKTQLTIAYAKRYKNTYSAVFWLNAKDADSLKQSFSRAAKQILREHPLTSQLSSIDMAGNLDGVIESVKIWLSHPKNTRWLLIYDNYDNPKIPGNTDTAAIDIRRYFPESYQGSIIITTRLSQIKLGSQIPIKKMTNMEDSLQILANESGRQLSVNGKNF
jgi:hypothetical protein